MIKQTFRQKVRSCGQFILMLAVFFSLAGCANGSKHFGANGSEMTGSANIRTGELVATAGDMQLILERSCSAPYSKYIFIYTSESGEKASGVVQKSGYSNAGLKVSVTGSGVDVSLSSSGDGGGTARVSFCGGEASLGKGKVFVTPGVYVPTVYAPAYLTLRGVSEVGIDGAPSVPVPSDWSAEKKILAYIDYKDDAMFKRFSEGTVYGQFSKISELAQMVVKNYDKAKIVGDNLYVMKLSKANSFVLVGYKESK